MRELNLDNDCATRSLVLGIGFIAIDWAIFFGWSIERLTQNFLFFKILVAIVGQKLYVFGSLTVVTLQLFDLLLKTLLFFGLPSFVNAAFRHVCEL